MSNVSNLCEIAIKYSELGWSVLPMRPDSKIPYIKWKPYQTQRATPAKIRQFWKIWPNAQIGIVTGKISNLVAIDFDSPEALERFQALVCDLPGTIVQHSGRENGGSHYLFQYPPDGTTLKSISGMIDNADTRAEGGYIIVPPSLHKSGNRYQWQNIDPLEHGLDDLMEMPPEILDFCKNRVQPIEIDRECLRCLKPCIPGIFSFCACIRLTRL